MAMLNQKTTVGKIVATSSNALEGIITKAITKLGASKENELCKYLPMPAGGYMHHFTLRKMKTEQPQELSQMIEEFINAVEKPIAVPPKPRAPRGSRKRRDGLNLTKTELDRMLHIARCAGDKDLVAKLMPKKSLAALKRELIATIRHNKVNHELWNSYSESIAAQTGDTSALRPVAPLFNPAINLNTLNHQNLGQAAVNYSNLGNAIFPMNK